MVFGSLCIYGTELAQLYIIKRLYFGYIRDMLERQISNVEACGLDEFGEMENHLKFGRSLDTG